MLKVKGLDFFELTQKLLGLCHIMAVALQNDDQFVFVYYVLFPEGDVSLRRRESLL